MVQRSTTVTVALAIAFTALEVTARPEFVARIPNGANVKGVTALGHVNGIGGGARNDFGQAFDAAGFAWTTELCQADSDGDGQTNGQELGDPCCQFVVGTNEKVQWTTGVSHPGDASSTSDESLWADISCDAASSASNSTTSAGSTATSSSTTSDTSTTSAADEVTSTTPTPTPTENRAATSAVTATITAAIVTTLTAILA